MIPTSALVGSSESPSKNRVFVYEVTGIRQNERNDKNSYPLRSSGSTFIRVPYNRMNEEMRRITRMGGKIVSIRPADAEQTSEE